LEQTATALIISALVELFSRITDVFKGRSFGNVEISYRTADGDKHYCITSLYPLFTDKGDVGSCVQ
jgi:hypothetical protein